MKYDETEMVRNQGYFFHVFFAQLGKINNFWNKKNFKKMITLFKLGLRLKSGIPDSRRYPEKRRHFPYGYSDKGIVHAILH